jgi:hypothetical protein
LGDFWYEILEQLQDLALALVIVIKEAVFGLAVFGLGHGVAWLIRRYSDSGDPTASAVTVIGDIGAVVLFVLLLIKDLRAYYRRGA